MFQCVAVCCSVLQCVAVCCSVLQCVAVCCSVFRCVASNASFTFMDASQEGNILYYASTYKTQKAFCDSEDTVHHAHQIACFHSRRGIYIHLYKYTCFDGGKHLRVEGARHGHSLRRALQDFGRLEFLLQAHCLLRSS